MLVQQKFVERIYNEVQIVHENETAENRRLIFIATCYQIYCPISYLKVAKGERTAGKLPQGIRDEIKRCLGFASAEMVNHYRSFTEPQMRPFNNGPERPFKIKVETVIEKFKQFSIRPEDTQCELQLA